MDEDRRTFLKQGLIAAGALGAGLGISKVIKTTKAPTQPLPHPNPLYTPVLTPEGNLVAVDLSQAANPHTCGSAHNTAKAGNPHPPAHTPAGSSAARAGVPGRKWVMVIDLAKCSGCGGCKVACNEMHQIPPDREWIKVLRMQESPNTAPYWFPKPCFHCDNPPCTRVCPVGATYKRQDGIVLIDNERCIGCRFCMAACPYSTRSFNWGRPDNSTVAGQTYSPETGQPRRVGTPEKCDFCPEMAKNGQLPGCVTGCDMGAIYYGDQNEDAVTNSHQETERFSQLLEERGGYRFMKEMGTEPRVYYLPPRDREFAPPHIEPKPKTKSWI